MSGIDLKKSKISVRTVSEKISVKGNSGFQAAWMNNCNSKNEFTAPRMPTKAERRSRRAGGAAAGDMYLSGLAADFSKGAVLLTSSI